ncbi:HNH endonuclease [Arthrobacter sp. YAF34]|uniref:HNH endonuclease n=1 Tax=Arthrobacter sp. YAF34 TaxID=3233083 RepID=UPI003F939449
MKNHEGCRKAALDLGGRPDDCLCTDCKRRKGVTTVRSVPPSARNRQGRTYAKHKLFVFERDDYICQICRLPTDPAARPSDDRYPTVDHIFPVALGGDDEVDNLRTAHRWCNIAVTDGASAYDDQVRELAQKKFG